MNSFVKSVPAMKGNFFFPMLIACLVIAAFNIGALPTRAGGVGGAQQAFDDWRAADEAAAKARDDLKQARAKRDRLMAEARKGGKQTAAQDKQLADAGANAAKAEAALEAAEAALLAARVALEKAIAELPDDDPLKQELKRKRDALDAISRAAAPTAQVAAANGLRTATFDTMQGRVVVNLPDDMRAGDTISGTVVAEPKGQTEEERTKNMSVLSGYVIDVVTPKKRDGTSNLKVSTPVTATPSPITFTLPPRNPKFTNVSRSNSGGLGITLTNTGGSLAISSTQTVPIEIVSLSLQSVTPITVHQLPTMGQQGRPIEIFGPFDGNSANTSLNWIRPRSAVQDFEKNTENVSGGFGLIAESPRKCVFTAPSNFTGPVEITLKEGNKETKGTYRNVGVNLSAPKTNLLKGEHTTLTVQVNGLEGIKEPVPLTLESHGVITMEGGSFQQFMIPPAQVDKNGNYITTRDATGVQPGVWGATVTVVTHPFSVCLQDDNNAQTVLLINSFYGDYIFASPGQTGGPTKPGKGSVAINGCTINLEHNTTDRVVTAKIDQCAKTGSASVQTSSPKMKFTITDRNTANNTCACGPGCK